MAPGHVEQWMVIMDFNSIGVTQMPISSLKGLVDVIQHHFRGRLYRMIAINSNWVMRAFWTAVWTWVDQYIKQKIIVCGSKDFQKELLKYVDESTLEVKYGGKQPDLTQPFFPPDSVFLR